MNLVQNLVPIVFTALACASLAVASCSGQDSNSSQQGNAETFSPEALDEVALPRGDRLLGFGITQGGIDYAAAFEQAKTAGIQFVELAQQWKEVEPAPGRFDSPLLPVLNSLYSQNDVAIVLSVNPLDTARNVTPDRFLDRPLNSAEVLESFNDFVDFVLQQLPDVTIVAVSIGNEIDTVITDARQWQQYADFAASARKHIQSRVPGVPVGVKTSLNALFGSNADEIALVNGDMDTIMLTYYPLDENYQVLSSGEIVEDIDKAIRLAGPKPVYLLETGFPSSEVNGSSLKLQSDFVDVIFKSWDQHGNAMPMVNFVWTHDMTDKQLRNLTRQFNGTDKRFVSFLGSLGLHREGGKPKPSWLRIKQHSQKRGWGSGP